MKASSRLLLPSVGALLCLIAAGGIGIWAFFIWSFRHISGWLALGPT